MKPRASATPARLLRLLVCYLLAIEGLCAPMLAQVSEEKERERCAAARRAIAARAKGTCTASEINAGIQLTLKKDAAADAVASLKKGIEIVEVRGGTGGACRQELARYYVYLGVSIGQLLAPDSTKGTERAAITLDRHTFLDVKDLGELGAFDRALRLDKAGAREALGEMEACDAFGLHGDDLFKNATAFTEAVARPSAQRTLPKWLVFSIGAFAAQPVHAGQAPTSGPLVLVGAEWGRLRLSVGPTIGYAERSAMAGGAIQFATSGKGTALGLVVGYGRLFGKNWAFTPTGWGAGLTVRFRAGR